MSKEYRGFKNYETWCVSLHLHNEQSLYFMTREMAQQFRAEYDEEQDAPWERPNVRLSEWIRDLIEEARPDISTGQDDPLRLLYSGSKLRTNSYGIDLTRNVTRN